MMFRQLLSTPSVSCLHGTEAYLKQLIAIMSVEDETPDGLRANHMLRGLGGITSPNALVNRRACPTSTFLTLNVRNS